MREYLFFEDDNRSFNVSTWVPTPEEDISVLENETNPFSNREQPNRKMIEEWPGLEKSVLVVTKALEKQVSWYSVTHVIHSHITMCIVCLAIVIILLSSVRNASQVKFCPKMIAKEKMNHSMQSMQI